MDVWFCVSRRNQKQKALGKELQKSHTNAPSKRVPGIRRFSLDFTYHGCLYSRHVGQMVLAAWRKGILFQCKLTHCQNGPPRMPGGPFKKTKLELR
jgi:hypothetical protein